MPESPLSRFTQTIKDSDKATESASETLRQIIETHSDDDAFGRYLEMHWDDAGKYLRRSQVKRQGLFRASAAGKCLQQQAFDVVADHVKVITVDIPLTRSLVRRPARQRRALWNGTFGHVRWHLFFDYLHELGAVKTLFAEELRYYKMLELSGTPDRVIEFKWSGRTFSAIIDFKTIKHEYFIKLVEPQDDHAAQQHCYGLMGFNTDRWMMLYEDKNDHELKIYDRTYNFETYEVLNATYLAAQRWVYQVLQAKPLTISLPIDTTWCRQCTYNATCKALHPERDKVAL